MALSAVLQTFTRGDHLKSMAMLCSSLNAELDPQQWPHVVNIREDHQSISLGLKIKPGLTWFDGHFPGHPVLPGVVQVHWAAELAKRFFMEQKRFEKIENLKFKSVVLPEMSLNLELTNSTTKNQVAFVFRRDQKIFSEGRITFVG